MKNSHNISRTLQDVILPQHRSLLLGGGAVLLYSFILVSLLPLPSIPPVAYIPPVLWCLFMIVKGREHFVIGFVIVGIIGQAGTTSFEERAFTEVILGEKIDQFGNVFLYPLYHLAIVASAVFFIRTMLKQKGVRPLYIFPLIFLAFAFLQLLFYYQTQGTYGIFTRSIVIMLLLSSAIGYNRFSVPELNSLMLMVASFVLFAPLVNILGTYGGRSVFVAALLCFPFLVYILRNRRWIYLPIVVLLCLSFVYFFIFSTFWYKVIIISSFISVLIYHTPSLSRIPLKFYFWIFPTFTASLALSSLFLEQDTSSVTVAGMIQRDRGAATIGDLTEYSFSEVKDLILFKYRGERVMFWKSCLEYTFSPLSMRAIFPEPNVLFEFTTGNLVGLPWTAGPHNGFIYLLRAYGAIIGLLIFLFTHFVLYKILTVRASPKSIFGGVLQPTLLTFTICGFSIGDYPIATTGAFTLFVIIGIGLSYAMIYQRSRASL